MLPIEKLPEPQDLLDYKRESSAPTYDGFTAFRQERDDAGNRIPRNETPFYKLREQLLRDTKGCLNLNHDYLRKERFSIFKNVIKRRLGEDQTQWNFQEVQRLISDYDDSSDGHHKAFKDFVTWYLRDWLVKNQSNTSRR